MLAPVPMTAMPAGETAMDLVSQYRPVVILSSFLAFVMAAAAPATAPAATKTLVVEAGKYARANVPMSVALPDGATKARMMDGAKEVPCQVLDGRLWWVLDGLDAGAARTYTVEPGADSAADAKAVEMKQDKETLEIAIDGNPFTTYSFGNPLVGRIQIRRPYFYPVLGPDQTEMTRAWPMVEDVPPGVVKDHPHHTSLWVAFGEVNKSDNWSADAKAGWQLHKSFEAVTSGPVVGAFRETLDWTSAAKEPNLAEVRTVRVYRLPPSIRILDLEVAFQAKYGPAVFGNTKEGGPCASRMRQEFVSEKGGRGRLVNAQGLTGADLWGKKAEWVDCSGPVEGKTYGYAIFDTPGNLRYPTRWHSRPYGLHAPNSFGAAAFEKGAEKGDYTLETGKNLTLRWRLYFHTGDEKEGQVAARYADYAEPPKAEWISQ
jgi:hypothetical protein